MPKYYELTLPLKRLMGKTDMLRYDRAFGIKVDHDGVCHIDCLRYTEARWASFGDTKPAVKVQEVSARTFVEIVERAVGFLEAMRFAQSIPDDMIESFGRGLVEG